MHRNVIPAALVAVLALAGCGGGGGEAGPATPEPPPTARAEPTLDRPSPVPAPEPSAADGEDYDACFDGECEVLVTAGVELEFDDEFRMGTTTVEFGEDFVRLTSRDGSGYLMFELGEGSQGNFQNTLNVLVVDLKADQAVLRFSPGEYER
jgi:hypothetical protein